MMPTSSHSLSWSFTCQSPELEGWRRPGDVQFMTKKNMRIEGNGLLIVGEQNLWCFEARGTPVQAFSPTADEDILRLFNNTIQYKGETLLTNIIRMKPNQKSPGQ